MQPCLDRVRTTADTGDHAALNVLHVTFETEPCGGGQGRQVAEHYREPAQQRQHPVSFGLLPPQLGELGDLVGMLGCQVFRLGEVIW